MWMTSNRNRTHSTPRRARWAHVLFSMVSAVTLMGTACGIGPGPGPAEPTPTLTLSGRKDVLKQQARELIAQGRYREALSVLAEAQVYVEAGQTDAEIQQLIDQARAALEPTPTATTAAPTATSTASPVPIATLNATTPDSAMGQDYFGLVFLAVVPATQDAPLPPPQDTYLAQDQIGLFLEAFSQGLRLPFSLRVFNRDTGTLIGEARFSPQPPPPPAPGAPAPPPAPVIFLEEFAWYHAGGELPGNYRVELYADTILTNTIDFRVTEGPPGVTPGPTFTPPASTPVPGVTTQPGLTPPALTPPVAGTLVPRTPVPPGTPGVRITPPALTPGAVPGLPTPKGAPERPGPSAPTVAPTPTPSPTPVPTATFTPTPSTVGEVFTGGIPAGIAYNAGIDRLYVADSSGMVWSVLNNQPVLQPPFKLSVERPGSSEQGSTDYPTGITVDPTTGLVYIGLKRSLAIGVFHGTTGERLKTLELPSRPTRVVVNPIQRLVYAFLPERGQLAILDPNQPTPLIATTSAPQATDMQVSEDGRTIFVSHFSGEISAYDARTGELRMRVKITNPGLYGIAQGAGMIFGTNVVTREIVTWDTVTGQVVARVVLAQQPAAIVYGPLTGTVYVVGYGNPLDAAAPPEPPVLTNVNPFTGVVNGFVRMTAEAGQMSQSPVGSPGEDPDLQALNNNLAVNPFSEIVYLINPEDGKISVAAPCLYPNLDETPAGSDIPRPTWLCPSG